MLAAVLRRAALCLLVAMGTVACAQTEADTPAARRQAVDRGFLLRRNLGPSQGDVSSSMQAARSAQAAQARAAAAPAPAGTAAPALSGSTTIWQPSGPTQLNTPAYGLVTGRISSLAVDPNDTSGNTVYLGATGGGVWKSTNAAGSAGFVPLTDDLPVFANSFTSIPSLSIGAITVQPGNPQVLLAGTGDPNDALDSYYGVGILRSGDGGNTWNLIQHSDGGSFNFEGIGFSGFAWSKTTAGLVVASASQSRDALLVNSNTTTTSEMGLYYSNDAGQTWYLATITDGPNQIILSSNPRRGPPGIAVTSVVWNSQRNLFLAAVRFHGYYSSPDGVTWTRLANQPGAGFNAQQCPASGSASCPIFRGVLAVQPVTGDTFALTTDINNVDQGLYRDVCSSSGLAVSSCNAGNIAFGTHINDTPLQAANGTIAQADYNLALSAVASQQDTVLFAGTEDIFRCSLANSCTWRNTTNDQTCAAAQVAPSIHAIDSTNGANGLIYFGNDGGLWRTTNTVSQTGSACDPADAASYQNLNGGIGSLAEISHLAVSPSNGSLVLAGMGGFGVVGSESSSAQADTGAWQQLLTGEGSFVAIDPITPGNWYADNGPGVSIFSCGNGGNCNAAGFGTTPVIGRAQVKDDADYFLEPAPWILDPLNPAAILLGTCRMWLGPVTGGWTSSNLLSTMLDGNGGSVCNGNAMVRSVGAGGSYNSPQGGEQMYAGMAGPADGGASVPGHLYGAIVPQAGGKVTWSDLWRNPVSNTPLSKQFNGDGYAISSIAVDPHDASGKTVYAGVAGFPTGQGAILYTSSDGGQTWFNITNTLPVAPVNSVVVDPNNSSYVYVGGDFGVYYTTNVATCSVTGRGFQACWAQLGGNLPNAPVTDLKVYNTGSQTVLEAATYGRGIWTIVLPTNAISAQASLSPGSYQFGSLGVGTRSSSPASFTLSNTGTNSLTVAQIAAAPGDYSQTNNCGSTLARGNTCTIQVSFTPTATGDRPGTLTVNANTQGGALTSSLDGTGLTPAAISVNPNALTFGTTATGSISQSSSVTVRNTGGAPLQFGALTLAGANPGDYKLPTGNCGSTLAAGSTCQISVAFAPMQTGTRAAQLQIASNDKNSPAVVNLSGTAVTPVMLSFSPTSLSFADTAQSDVSAAQSITLTNSGGATAQLGTPSVMGDYQTTRNGCGSTLVGGASCSLNIAFAPAGTGNRSGLLTVPSPSIANGQVTAALSGNGVPPPAISFTPNPVSFGSQQQGTTVNLVVKVVNSGGSAAQLGTPVVTQPSGTDFALVSNGCPASLAVNATGCTITVSFTPSATNPRSGTLTLPVNNTSASVALSGTGTAPGMLSFTPASVTFDTTAQMTASPAKSISVTNNGSNPATISSVTVTAPFSLAANSCPQTLAVNAVCTLQVVFTPPGTSAYSGSMTVSGSFGNAPASVPLSGQGATPPAITFNPTSLSYSPTAQGSASMAQTLGITSTGGVPVALGTPSVTSDYQISSNNCPTTLAVGNSCQVAILFHPTAVGQRNGTFSQSGSQPASPATVALTGTGLAPGVITLSPSSLNFGSLVDGATSASQTVTASNTGGSPAPLGIPSTTGEYVLTGNTCGATLGVGQSCTLAVAFTPKSSTTAADRPGQLSIPGDGSAAASVVILDGTGTTPGMLSITPSSLAFGKVATGSSASQSATVTNGGGNPVHLSAITAGGDFSVTGGTCTPTGTIAVGGSCTVTVTFAPTSQTNKSGTLTVMGDGTPASAQAGLAGIGAAPANVTLSPGSLAFGSIVIGTASPSQTVTATNSGGVSVTLGSPTVSSGYSIQSDQCGSSLASGASCTLQVVFMPTAAGDSSGTLSLPGAYSSSPATVSLDGNGVTPGMLVISPNPVSFGVVVIGSSSTLPVTVQNTGGAPVSIGTPSTTSGYSVTGSCGGSIAPGASCTLQVSFTPTSSGMLSGLLTVPGQAGGGSATATLGGTGVPPGALAAAPASLNYPDTVIGGSSATQIATFHNSGGVTVPLHAPQVFSSDFTITNNGCGATLDPGATCNVSVAFTPGSAGARSDALRLTGGGGVSAQVALTGRGLAPARLAFSPPSLHFAPQNSNTTSPSQVLTLQNTGDVATSLGAAVLGGEYLIASNSCGSSLAGGGTCQIAVQLAPQDAGTLPGSLSIGSTSGSPSATALLSGSGLVLAISSTVPEFTQVLVGTSVTSPTFLTIENLGKTTLPIQFSLTGDFTLGASTCGATLPANSSCSLQVTFTPTGNGLRTGTFTVSDGTETHSVQLSGTGLFPATDTLSMTALSFSNTQLGSRSASQSVLLTNSGDATLTFISVQTAGAFSAANGCGASLGGHLSCTVAVSFVPATVGAATGTLTINDTISFVQHTQVVTLSGQGTPPPQAYTAPSHIDFGPYALNIATQPQLVTLSNPGSSPISNLVPSISAGDFSIASNTCAASLNPGASCQIGVIFTPSVIGNREATLTVQGTGASFGEPLVVSLTGSGEDFQFNVVGSPTATITTGQTAVFPFNVTPAGTSTGSVTLACSGAPVNATCTVNPTLLSLASGAGGSFSVSVSTGVNATKASLAERHRFQSWLGSAALAMLCPLVLLRGEQRRRFGLLLVALALLGSPLACGVSASGAKLAQNAIIAGQTPSGTYPITVTISFPGAQRTATVTVIVQ